MRKSTKVLLTLLGILLVTALLVLLGRWMYRPYSQYILRVDEPTRKKIEEAIKKVSTFSNICDLHIKQVKQLKEQSKRDRFSDEEDEDDAWLGGEPSDGGQKSDYRIGDMIRGVNSERDRCKGKDWHIRTYPKSIVSNYFAMTSDESNIEVLASIVKKRSEQLSAIQGCALHLRIGDVMEGSDYTVSEFLDQPRLTYPNKLWSQYVTCWRSIEYCLDHHVQSRSITIFAGAHSSWVSDFPKSCQYINTIQYLLEQKGYKVSRRLGEDADEDFVLMSTAPYFIQSGGGYSRLINKVRKRLGLPSCNVSL